MISRHLRSASSPGQILLLSFERVDFIFRDNLGRMAQVCSVILHWIQIFHCLYPSWCLSIPVLLPPFEAFWALLVFNNKPKSWFLNVSRSRQFLKYPWNDQLMFSLIKIASSILKAGKLRKWAPHLVSELSFYSLRQNYQHLSNLLYIRDEINKSWVAPLENSRNGILSRWEGV